MFIFHLEKWIHLVCGAGFFGVNLMNYALISQAIQVKDPVRLRFMLKSSLLMDFLIPIVIFILFLTGTTLVISSPYTFQTPWIEAAYGLLGLSLGCWFGSTLIKLHNFRRLTAHQSSAFLFKKTYHWLNIIIIILLIGIIHDAVMRSTYF